MNFSIFIRSAPYTQPGSYSALHFTKALLADSSNNKILQIFFYLGGVQHANDYITTQPDELNLLKAWADISATYNIPLHICSTSAGNYGILKDKNLSDDFILSGLGQLSSLILSSDRVIEF
jgi:tRNA 2-thiouridine synthesizing protein D